MEIKKYNKLVAAQKDLLKFSVCHVVYVKGSVALYILKYRLTLSILAVGSHKPYVERCEGCGVCVCVCEGFRQAVGYVRTPIVILQLIEWLQTRTL